MTGRDLTARVSAHARSEPGAPLVTFYDDTTGERTELSRATAGNWAAKTASFLEGDGEVERGDVVGLALHPHWQVTVTALACWSLGAAVAPLDPSAGAAEVADRLAGAGAVVALAREDLLAELAARRPAGLRELVGVSQRPLAARLRSTPPGVLDLAAEVPPQPDDFAPLGPPDPDDPAVVAPGETLDAAGLLARAEAVGDALGLTATDRLLVSPEAGTPAGLVVGTAAPALAGAGVVLCRDFPGAGLAHRLEQERVSVLVVDEAQAGSALAALLPGPPPPRLRAVAALGPAGAAAEALADRLGVPLVRL